MTHPPCKKCQKAGLECLQKRPLRWVDGPAFRNRARTSQAHQRDKSNTLNKGKCVCKLFVMFDSQRNPLRQLIPAALANPALTASVMALSARHMANGQQIQCQGQDEDHATRFKAHTDGLMYKQKAICGLIQALNDPISRSRDVLILSAFILIFLDLLESGRDQWKSHLGGIKKLVSGMHTAETSRHLEATIEGTREFIMGQIYLMLDSTMSFDCHNWVTETLRASSTTSTTRNIQSLEHLAQAYKSATLIYGWRVCDRLTGNETPLDDLVKALVVEAETLRRDEALFKCILWPLFIAGLESQEQSQKSHIRNCLESFWFETKCINVINAVTILERFWVDPSNVEDDSSSWVFRMGQLEGDWLLI
ncbi:hypothetical protein ASPNIDRAFT_44782 [Aspergillus niger ATCC 1015]|uniref:Uncharacterized protein n=1 Tax=Aspergillus niger (strain ATCC 1015 / CBS 113.46 / FGSC A1144 / LSHB Ac4 / NCTC 3858a / NRRL 328 / USDA 3528.7) TaxID=380704 RepID=G3XPZ5_ASPNA|nr:hypothetical protein ASPNIDRAFT_44782 [Aspergillus niger ATCC 1015]